MTWSRAHSTAAPDGGSGHVIPAAVQVCSGVRSVVVASMMMLLAC